MKSNNFLGLVGTAATMFALFSVACAAPATVSRSGDSDDDDTSTSRRQNDDDDDMPSSSTATTTGSTTTTPPSSPTTPTTPTTPTNTVDPQSCTKLATCAEKITNTYEKLGYLATSFAGDQKICSTALFACQAGGVTQFFGNACDDLTDCCTEMNANGNSSQANTCRSKANTGDGSSCKTQLSTYRSQGLCN